MAIAGRSYASVPIVLRGSLEDPEDFRSKTAVVIFSSQPTNTQLTVLPAATWRNTLQDPPVLTTPAPVVVAAAADPRWFKTTQPFITANPQAPAAPALATPAPVVLTPPSAGPLTVQAYIFRNNPHVTAGAPGMLMAGIV